MEAIALAFGEEPRPSPRDAAQRALSNRRVLLFLDGTEEADDLQAILQIAGSCGVIVTSRRQKDAPDKRTDLMPLNAEEAVLLLRSWGGDVARDTQAARQIIELVGGLPLAVRLVGRYLAQTQSSASEYLQWLAETPLDALDQGKRQSESIEVLLSRSLEQVNEQARDVLSIAGTLALAPFTREVIQTALPKIDVRHALGELINYGLLIRNQESYEISNALIYSYIRKRIYAPDEQVINLSKYYIALSKELNALGLKGFIRLDVERSHLVTVLSRCIERELWDIAQSLVWAIGTPESYFALQGYWVEWIRSLEAGLVASRMLKHSQDEAAFLDFLGIAYRSLGQVNKAIEYHEQALVIAHEINNQHKECENLGDLGLAYSDLGQLEKAVEYYQKALTLAREIGDRRVEGINLGNLGIAYHDLGEVKQAIDYLEQALSISKDISDRHSEGEILGNLGLIYSDLGQSNEAVEFYQQALTIARKIGDRRNEGAWLGNLGLTYHNLGQVEQAIEYYEQALTIAREIGDRRNEGNWLGNLGNVHSSEGVVDKAIEHYEQALSITREIGDRRREGNWLGSLGNTYYLIRDDQKAIEHYQQALAIAREVGDRHREANWLGNLGLVYYSLGQTELAKSYLNEALVIFENIKSPYVEHIRQLLARLDNGSYDTRLTSNATITFYLTEKMTPKYLADYVVPYFQAVADFQYLINEIRNQPPQEVEILSLTKGSVDAVVSGATDAIRFIMEIVVPWRYEHAKSMAKLDEAEKQIHIEDISEASPQTDKEVIVEMRA